MDKKNVISLVLGLIIGGLAVWLMISFTDLGATMVLRYGVKNATPPSNSTGGQNATQFLDKPPAGDGEEQDARFKHYTLPVSLYTGLPFGVGIPGMPVPSVAVGFVAKRPNMNISDFPLPSGFNESIARGLLTGVFLPDVSFEDLGLPADLANNYQLVPMTPGGDPRFKFRGGKGMDDESWSGRSFWGGLIPPTPGLAGIFAQVNQTGYGLYFHGRYAGFFEGNDNCKASYTYTDNERYGNEQIHLFAFVFPCNEKDN